MTFTSPLPPVTIPQTPLTPYILQRAADLRRPRAAMRGGVEMLTDHLMRDAADIHHHLQQRHLPQREIGGDGVALLPVEIFLADLGLIFLAEAGERCLLAVVRRFILRIARGGGLGGFCLPLLAPFLFQFLQPGRQSAMRG